MSNWLNEAKVLFERGVEALQGPIQLEECCKCTASLSPKQKEAGCFTIALISGYLKTLLDGNAKPNGASASNLTGAVSESPQRNVVSSTM